MLVVSALVQTVFDKVDVVKTSIYIEIILIEIQLIIDLFEGHCSSNEQTKFFLIPNVFFKSVFFYKTIDFKFDMILF